MDVGLRPLERRGCDWGAVWWRGGWSSYECVGGVLSLLEYLFLVRMAEEISSMGGVLSSGKDEDDCPIPIPSCNPWR